MTTPLLTRIETDLAARSSTVAATEAIARFTIWGVEITGATPIELARTCRSGNGDPWSTTIALLAVHACDEWALVTALVALRPRLEAMARTLAGWHVPATEAESIIVTAAVEALSAATPPAGPSTVPQVLAEVWRQARSEARRLVAYDRRRAPTDITETAVFDKHSDVTTVLVQAVRGGAVTRVDAVLVFETRVLGRTLAEVAASKGVAAGTLASRRRRAEQVLRGLLGGEV